MVSRIRYIAHECLRDQVGGPAVVTVPPEVQAGKKSRGKERVRRKSSSKRPRKDDPAAQYAAASEDNDHQPRFGAAALDHMHLHHHNGGGDSGDLDGDDDDDMHLCADDIVIDEASKADVAQFLNEPEKGGYLTSCSNGAAANENKDSQISNVTLDAGFEDAMKVVINSQLHDEMHSEAIESQISNEDKEAFGSQQQRDGTELPNCCGDDDDSEIFIQEEETPEQQAVQQPSLENSVAS